MSERTDVGCLSCSAVAGQRCSPDCRNYEPDEEPGHSFDPDAMPVHADLCDDVAACRIRIRELESKLERLRVQAQGFGRPQGLPLTTEDAGHLRDRAEGVSDGLWINPDVLVALLAVYSTACSAADARAAVIAARHDPAGSLRERRDRMVSADEAWSEASEALRAAVERARRQR